MLDTAIYWITGGHGPQVWMPWILICFGCIITYTVVRYFKGQTSCAFFHLLDQTTVRH